MFAPNQPINSNYNSIKQNQIDAQTPPINNAAFTQDLLLKNSNDLQEKIGK